MTAIYLEIGMVLAAFGLIIGAVYLFLTGGSNSVGEKVRGALTPSLRAVRDGSSLSRGELAERSVLVGAALVLASGFIRLSIFDVAVAILLYHSRTKIRRSATEEQPLRAIAGFFSTDMIVGIYVPIILAMFILGSVMVALGLASVVIALCWPPGGAGFAAGAWRPAWANS